MYCNVYNVYVRLIRSVSIVSLFDTMIMRVKFIMAGKGFFSK